MLTVNEVSKRTGVSVRTLHHYDSIGLLRPTAVTEAGYRLYDDAALSRLSTILFFRELEFPLREIKRIIDSPDFDAEEAVRQQIELLKMRRDRLDSIISLACRIQETGVNNMDFSPFDKTEIEKYTDEAKKRWGSTEAFRQFESKNMNEKELSDAASGLMDIFARLGRLRHLAPDCDEVQSEVGALRQFITDNYYTCTVPIFRGLGQMYVCDERMTKNIDAAGGEGTAEFASRAIEIYCKD
ncbi:MAG: MerR family transcriptional regulator [Clostridia bacterium]|nr:MerR family transcriptional regulator [Clostridia bacterium]